ncbi:MAG TPA: hypothetical protein VGJ28_25415 [Micromonosporaceae bacterium]
MNRFDDECGEYHRFAAGVDCRLSYITLPVGLPVIGRDSAQEIVVVDNLALDTVTQAAQEIVERHGSLDGIVGISEKDVLMTAHLRERMGMPGWRPEFIRRFKDKPTMKTLVRDAGLRVPHFVPLGPDTTADDVLRELNLPVVLKPRQEAASRGVVILYDADSLKAALATVDPAAYECEDYISGEIYHIDGVRRGGVFHFVSASRYLNTCLDFANGQPLGSVTVPDGDLRSRLFAFAAECFDALGLFDAPFHLEVIDDKDGGLVFLENAIRPGGAEIPFINHDCFGADLFGEAFRATLGLPPMTEQADFTEPAAAGWVSIPEPRPFPSRVIYRESLLDAIPEIYAELLPPIGEVFDGTGGYDHIAGRFRLRGESEQQVEDAALRIMRDYVVHSEPA